MLNKCLKEEQEPRVDKRQARVVRIIVEQYGGDVRAFVESIRSRGEETRRAEAQSRDVGEAVWQRF
jgi:hypothetical protein